MSNNENGGCAFMFIWIITIGISIGTGIISWKWINPDSFWSALAFLIIWGIISRIGNFIAVLIGAMFFQND